MTNTPNAVLMRTLRYALSMARPHGSVEEGRLVSYLGRKITELQPLADQWVDPAGNLHVDMRTKRTHKTLFVAHVDTVHRAGGPNVFDSSSPMWTAQGGQPLGADDGAGVALMTGLIAGGVRGYYVFTRGEERGGVGAKYLAEEMPDLLCEFDRAIAVDRRDVFSVITHQAMGRCCSDAFAETLCHELNSRGMLMMPDDTGVYTDTAEFVDFIPECTNISAGYYWEHSPKESLDTDYLQQLLGAMLTVKWDDLPTERSTYEDEDELAGWSDAYDRWRMEQMAFDEDKLSPVWDESYATDPFAWSDDMKTVSYGAERKRVRSLS